MHSASAAPSRRGSLGESGPLAVEQRAPTSRPRLSFLERVDEANESDGLASTDARAAERSRRSSRMASPPELFSSDEEIENLHHQMARTTRRSSGKFTDRRDAEDPLVRRLSVPSRRSSLRAPLQTLPCESQRPSGLAIAATLNEKKQKKLVALFYWHRRTMETFFSAWKWVVFDTASHSRVPHHQSESTKRRPYAQVEIRPMDRSYPRHHSALLKNTLERQRRALAVNTDRESNHRDRINSLRDEYRQLRTSAMQEQQLLDGKPAKEIPQPEDDAATKRYAFKERLRVYYRCFTAWQVYVSECHIHSARLDERACGHYRKRQLQRLFRPWAKAFLVLCRLEKERWRRLCEQIDRRALRRRFQSWKRWLEWKQDVKRRALSVMRRRIAHSVSRWRMWTERTIRLHQADVKSCRIVLQRHFARLKTQRIQRQDKRLIYESADVVNRRQSLRRVWSQWRQAVFADDDAARMLSLTRLLSQKSAVTKWKRFVARRRQRYARAEELDRCLYEGLLRRFWRRWGSYLSLQVNKRGVYDCMTRQWASGRKRQAIRSLLSHRGMRKYERDRAQVATAFYLARRGRESLCAWRAHVQTLRRVRQFRYVRVKRHFVLCAVAWRQYTIRSRRLRALQDAVFAHRREKILKQSMHVWWHGYKVCSTYRLVDARYASRLLEKYVKQWRSIVVRSRTLRKIIQQLNRKRFRLQTRRLFSAWRRLAVGERCRRRIIRLFQTKQLCKRLRNCVHVMHHHAKLLRLKRSVDSRRLESAWHSWATFTSDEQHQAKANALATRFYRRRRYLLAVDLWRYNTRQWSHARQCNARAIGHLITRIMRATLHAWCKTCRIKRRRQELIERQATRYKRLRLQRCITEWKMVSRASRRQRHEVHRLWRRAMLRRRELAFFAWRVYLTHKKVHQRVYRDARRAFEQRRGLKVLRVWRRTTVCLQQHRVTISAARSERRRRTLNRVLCGWRVVAAKWHRTRMNNVTAAKFHREFLLLWAMYGWQHATLAHQVVCEKQRRVVEAMARKKLERAMEVWKRRLSFGHADKTRLQRANAHYQSRRHRSGVQAWRAFVTSRHERHNQSRIVLALATTKLKRRTFRVWLQFTAGTRAFKTKLRRIFKTGDDDIQRKAFRCWWRYKRKTTLDQRAIQWRKRSVQRTVWRYWCHHMTFTRAMRRNVLITNRLLQYNTTRTSFTQWQQYIASRHKQTHALETADDYYVARCYRTVFRGLRVAVRQARAKELSAAFYGTHMQRQYFRNWRQGVFALKTRREQKALMTKRAVAKQISRAFTGWRDLMKTKQRMLQSKANRYGDTLALKHTWKAWTRVVIYRHSVNSFRTRQSHRETLASFRQWMAFVRDQQQIRRHVDAAVAHVDRVTMQKIWERWVEYLGERRESHRLNAIASSFHATRIVQQRRFRVWTSYVSHRRDRQAQQLKADAFCVALSWRRCFEQWEKYVARRQTRTQVKQTEEQAIRRLVVTRALRAWRNRASTLRSLSDAQARATLFFVRRASSKAVLFMVCHAMTKKQHRKRHTHAIIHRKHQLIRRFFMQWTSFLVWGQRHRNLLRLFWSNQLTDHFTQWRKYLVHTQRKRTLQATATRAHRGLMQRSSFTRWRVRCRHWRNKRQAIQWYNEQVGRFVLGAWAHRMRVLKKMRHLFRFQNSCRLESHFHTWKRYWWRKKQQVVRVHEAVVWFERNRQAKCFTLWARWRDAKYQEKATLRTAIGFRSRFFSRKYLHAWRSVAAWTRRKISLQAAARQSYRLRLYRNALQKLFAYTAMKRRMRETTSVARQVLMDLKIQRSVATWKQFLLSGQNLLFKATVAVGHHSRIVVQHCWSQFICWYAVRRVKRSELQRAERHADQATAQRAFHAWLRHVRNQRRLCTGLQQFKERFFCTIAKDYFVRWTSLVACKRRLRMLKHKVERSSQRQTLHAWHTMAHESRRRHAAIATMDTRRCRRLLQYCVLHWERVATDCWMHSRLVCTALTRHARYTKASVVQRWKTLLPLRRARKTWRERARIRHRQFLVDVLQSWRRCAAENASGSDADGGTCVD